MEMGIISWMTNCVANAIACFRASNTYNGLTNLFLEIDQYTSEGISVASKKRIILYVILSCIIIAVNVVSSFYLMFFTTSMDIILAPIDSDHHNAIYLKATVFFIQIYMTAAWLLPVFFMLILCSVLMDLFSRFNKCFQAKIMCNGYSLPPDFEKLRQKHLTLCRLVTYADSFLCIFNGVTLLSCSIILTAYTYNIIWYDAIRDDVTVLLVTLFWTFGGAMQILLISIGGGMLNTKARESVNYLYDVSADTIPQDKQIHITLFLSKLNGPPIGISALGMFVIDKPVILTIIGLLATYFVIIVQFSPFYTGGDESGEKDCDCTELIMNATLNCYSTL